MAEELDYKTFDLVEVLSGRAYPETEVEVYFDENLGFTIQKVREAIDEADRRGEDETASKLQKELDSLVEQVADAKYTVHLKGVDESKKKAILRDVREEFPPKRNPFGVEEENLDADEAYTRKLWALMIVRIEDPKGAISLMNEELAKFLQDKAPKSAQVAINKGIHELEKGSEAGFEFAAKEVPFLSIASPEG